MLSSKFYMKNKRSRKNSLDFQPVSIQNLLAELTQKAKLLVNFN